ncbi:hypothetical protein RSOLAG1IB_10162 [Rhizoctonia solani AG-1 IB]|uniref:Uncharacterized protein n=1 Tax=Thanatephorus cucumeris (strain AG1-IB / isolate 7/3/14) TaxID=1108050 RepID=A0A0B7FYX2_THACB|nr:hypothetical protein RSOLAG1IB_10162 [Rhizoctonia solani AG-1 IB]
MPAIPRPPYYSPAPPDQWSTGSTSGLYPKFRPHPSAVELGTTLYNTSSAQARGAKPWAPLTPPAFTTNPYFVSK